MSSLRRHHHEQNRLSWNASTRAHSGHTWRAFDQQVPGPDGNFVLPPEIPQIPMMFGLRASKR